MSHYFENDTNLKSEIRELSYKYNSSFFTFYSDNGVFSKNAIDFGKNHPKMIDTNIIYGDALFSKRQFVEALKYYQTAYNELLAVNNNHPDIAICLDKIDSCKKK